MMKEAFSVVAAAAAALCILFTISAVALAVQDQTVQSRGAEWTMVQGEPVACQQTHDNDRTTLTTVIQDPRNPEEPWTVTTYQRDRESPLAFAIRHDEMVGAVRGLLEGANR